MIRRGNPAVRVILIAATIGVPLLACQWANLIVISNYDRNLIANDSIGYQDVARNIRDGHGFTTYCLYYDEQYLADRLPAPDTVHPMGFPCLIAGLAAWSGDVGRAAFVLDVVSLNLTGLLIYMIVASGECGRVGGVLASLAWFVTAAIWFNALLCLAEMPFAASTAAALFCLCKAQAKSSYRWLLFSGVWIGLAFAIRYAGLFYMASVAAFHLLRYVHARSRRILMECTVNLSIPAAVVAAIFLRNLRTVGVMTGGPNHNPGRSFGSVLWMWAAAYCDILGVSPKALMRCEPGSVILFSSLIVIISLMAYCLARQARRPGSRADLISDPAVTLSLSYVIATNFFIVYAGLTSPVDVEARMFLPIFPFAIVLAGRLIGNEWKARSHTFYRYLLPCILLVLGPALLHGQFDSLQSKRADREGFSLRRGRIHAAISGLTMPGRSPVIANESFYVSTVLGRPTLGLGSSQYTGKRWDADAVRSMALRLGPEYVLLLRESHTPDDEIPLFDDLRRGNVPNWLTLIFQDSRVTLYRVNL